MTDRTLRTSWEIICKRCGEPVVKHTVYFTSIPPEATEGEFDDQNIRGFYCLNNG